LQRTHPVIDIGLTRQLRRHEYEIPSVTRNLSGRLSTQTNQLDRSPANHRRMSNRHEDSSIENGANRLRIGVRATGFQASSWFSVLCLAAVVN
jgi:hypothetical protein